MRKSRWMLPAVLLVIPAVAGAGDKEGYDHEAMMQDWMANYAMPGEEHKSLDYFVGDWSFTNTANMGGKETVSEGTTRCELTMGGRYLSAHHASDFEGMPFEGHAITGYDRVAGEYFNLWFDNMGTGYMESRGETLAGDKGFETKGVWSDPVFGAMDFRMRTEIESDDSYTFKMYMGPKGGPEDQTMVIKYKRLSS